LSSFSYIYFYPLKSFQDKFRIRSIRFYSTNTVINQELDIKFLDWLRGFIDSEACFYFNMRDRYKTGNFSPEFAFHITLHIDDAPALNYIKKNLNLGRINISKTTASFQITKKEDIFQLIKILDKFTLNSSKYLDYLAFKEAFFAHQKHLNEFNKKTCPLTIKEAHIKFLYNLKKFYEQQ
jgi:hypothetical protein